MTAEGSASPVLSATEPVIVADWAAAGNAAKRKDVQTANPAMPHVSLIAPSVCRDWFDPRIMSAPPGGRLHPAGTRNHHDDRDTRAAGESPESCATRK